MMPTAIPMRTALLVLSLALAAAACGRGSSPPPPAPLGALSIDARELNDDSGGIPDSVTLVIRDAATLQDVWTRATSKQNPPPPMPQLDFGRQMLLLVAAGRIQPEIELRVDSVGVRRELMPDGRQREVLTVLYIVTEGCRRLNQDAWPLEIVRVRRFDGDVRFIGRREQASNCR